MRLDRLKNDEFLNLSTEKKMKILLREAEFRQTRIRNLKHEIKELQTMVARIRGDRYF